MSMNIIAGVIFGIGLGTLYILLPSFFMGHGKIRGQVFMGFRLASRLLIVGAALYLLMKFFPVFFIPCCIGIIAGSIAAKISLIKFFPGRLKEPVR